MVGDSAARSFFIYTEIENKITPEVDIDFFDTLLDECGKEFISDYYRFVLSTLPKSGT